MGIACQHVLLPEHRRVDPSATGIIQRGDRGGNARIGNDLRIVKLVSAQRPSAPLEATVTERQAAVGFLAADRHRQYVAQGGEAVLVRHAVREVDHAATLCQHPSARAGVGAYGGKHRYVARQRIDGKAGLVGEFVTLPVEKYSNASESEKHNHHIYNQFVIRVQKRDQLREFLTHNEIGCEVYYPLCLHQQKCLEKYDLPVGSYPESERAAMESLALPIYPELQSDQLEYVVETISRFFRL